MKTNRDLPSPIHIKIGELHFDKLNPRLAEHGLSENANDDEILKVLWDTMDVQEIVQSIYASGFFPHEPLFVVKERGKYVVIEGNRRLAALKTLTGAVLPEGGEWTPPRLSEADREALDTVPAIITDRKSLWRYLGFRHVNGPAKWSSYAKASYIAEVHRDWKIPLLDIAEQIGDRHNTVQRLYRGLMVLEQAEAEDIFDRNDAFRVRLAFSHLYTILDYVEVASFLNIAPKETETSKPVPRGKLKQLGELMGWLYGSRKLRKAPLVLTQNPHLRQLNAAIGRRESLSALRAGVGLEKAFELSLPSSTVLEDSLLAAKRSLSTAQSHLTTGYDNSEAVLRIAGDIANIADDIYEQMQKKRTGKSRKPRLA